MNSQAPRQLVLDLAPGPAYGSEDFLVSPSNQHASAFVENWPAWPSAAALLVGPAGVGKTHLLEIWRRRSGAAVVDISSLDEALVPDIMPSGGAVALEHAPDATLNERALFHLLNAARENRGYVLIASRTTPRNWNLTLPDLISRLAAAPAIHIQPADEDLLRGVLVKLFADRQCAVDAGFVEYLMTRMPRSLGSARRVVAAIDERALATGAARSRAIASRVLADLVEQGFAPEDGA